jgi:hypothetical protein
LVDEVAVQIEKKGKDEIPVVAGDSKDILRTSER